MNDEYVTASAAWFTLSLINAGLAQGKGRSGLKWWLLSLFLGPLATFLIVASPPAEPAEDGRETEGRMTQRQALIIGGAIIVILLLILGVTRFLTG